MVEQETPKFSDYYGPFSDSVIDEVNRLIPLEINPQEARELAKRRGFHLMEKEMDVNLGRVLISVDPGLNIEHGRYGCFAFYVQGDVVYICDTSKKYLESLLRDNHPVNPAELTFLIQVDGTLNPKFKL